MHDLKIDLQKSLGEYLGVYPKIWGREIWMVNNQDYCWKILDLNAGFRCSRHCHVSKKETFVVLDGKLWMETWTTDYPSSYFIREMWAGHQIFIPNGTFHRFSSKTGALISEVSTNHREEDVERTEESGPIP